MDQRETEQSVQAEPCPPAQRQPLGEPGGLQGMSPAETSYAGEAPCSPPMMAPLRLISWHLKGEMKGDRVERKREGEGGGERVDFPVRFLSRPRGLLPPTASHSEIHAPHLLPLSQVLALRLHKSSLLLRI